MNTHPQKGRKTGQASRQISPRGGQRCNQRESSGFALVVAIALMSLILLMLVGLSVSVQLEMHSSATTLRQKEAQANALLGLQIGLSELQRLSGPDTRITAQADILGLPEDSPYRYWTGVWNSADANPDIACQDHTKRQANDPNARQEPMGWLVSMPDNRPEDIDPLTTDIPDEYRVPLVSTQGPTPEVVAGRQSFTDTDSFAWWVGDEGVKASIDTRDAIRDGTTTLTDFVGESFSAGDSDEARATLIAAALAHKSGVEHLGGLWEPLTESETSSTSSRAVNYDSLRPLFGVDTPDEETAFLAARHDLTVYSRGLLTDVRKGGFKKDLTLAFNNDDVFEQFFGARPVAADIDSGIAPLLTNVVDFSSQATDFYLTPEIQAENGKTNVGPNWGTLYHYYHLYEQAADGEIAPIIAWPYDKSAPARQPDPRPYQNYGVADWTKRDDQHTNNPLSPVIERVMFIVRAGAEPKGTDNEGNPTNYKLKFYIQPVIGLWNPYNVKITEAYSGGDSRYKIESESLPEFVISGTYQDGTTFTETINLATALQWGDKEKQSGGYWAMHTPLDLDFEPGEIRLMSTVKSSVHEAKNYRNLLDYGFKDTRGFFIYWPFEESKTYTPPEGQQEFIKNEPVTIHSVAFKDRSDEAGADAYSGAFILLKHTYGSSGQANMQRYSGLWKDTVYANGDADLEPGQVTDGTYPPFLPSENVGSSYVDIGAWAFNLRTTYDESGQGIRNLIDANLRAITGTPRWDGPGLFTLGAYTAPGNNGYLAPGIGVPPVFDDYDRDTGINGASISDPNYGRAHVPLFDIPRMPLVSLGQFQHATLGRYSFEPAYLVGNSYANPRIPLDDIVHEDFDDQTDMNLFDTAYLVNDSLFDEYFFSTFDPQTSNADFQALREGSKRLYNTRHQFATPADSEDLNDLLDTSNADSVRAWGGRFMVDGAFNVNSTSVSAWKALLSSMDQPFLKIDINNAAQLDSTDTDGVYISHFSLPLFAKGYEANDSSMEAFFQGYRQLSDTELNDLAQAIVIEVKSRGPFLSMADFVNRRLDGSTEQKQRGALQAALDSTVNQNINHSIARQADSLTGGVYSDAIKTTGDWTDSQAAGYPGYVLQGDLLQPLAPVLTVRSDTFVIRAYGQAEAINGASSEAWCEAVVQRYPDMVGTGNDLSADSLAELGRTEQDLLDPENQLMGRAYRIISFRWLNKDEI